MRESELESVNHRSHALEWRSEDTCLLCLMEVIRAGSGNKLRIHRRFALATLIQKLNPDVSQPSGSQRETSSRNLARLLQKNGNVSSQVLATLLDALTTGDLVDLAVEAVYRLYHRVLRDDAVLNNVLTHCVDKIGENLAQPEKWVPYLSVMQRLAQLSPSAVALAMGQNAKLENEIVEHLSDHFNEFVALHMIALLDPVLKSDDQLLIRPTRRPLLMLQLAHLLQNVQCQQLQFAVLGFALTLWLKEDLHQQQDGLKIQQLTVATVNGLKRVVLQNLPDIQVAALQVLDCLLLKCGQLTDGWRVLTVLLEEQDVAELMYDILYSNHLPLLELALRCLHHLSRCPAFFQHRCVILGVEPLLRVIPHLAGSNASAVSGGLIVAYAVHLLSDMLTKYDGEESLLLNGGFQAACHIALMALQSCALHLETGGACLVAALLDGKNLPVPIPTERVVQLIRSCDQSLAPLGKKWKTETGQVHLQAMSQVLSAGTKLIVHLTDNPHTRLSSYSATVNQLATSTSSDMDRLIELIIASVEKLISAFQQVDKESLWSDLFNLLVQLASSSTAGAAFVEKTLKTGLMLSRCFGLRGKADVAEAADDLLTWFLARSLDGNQPGPLGTLRSLLRSVPASVADLGDWISRDKRAPFGAKCFALVLLYQLELSETSNKTDGQDLFVGQHSEAILTAIGDLMLTRSPCDMDDPDLLRSVWFLIARYSRGWNEASKAFVHLVKWFQPNSSLLVAWLRRIYTAHLCLMRWAFAVNDIAHYMGSYMILLWIDDEDDVEGERARTLVELCLEKTDDDVLLLSVFDLAFHDRADVSCLAVDVMQRVAEKSDAMRVAIGRMIKYNIPRFLRLTDVTDDDNYARLVGSLRLLCRLARPSSHQSATDDVVVESATAWRDPAIVAALVSFLPRTIRPDQQQVKLGAMELWSWSCRYIKTVIQTAIKETASHRVLTQIVMENRAFVEFVDHVVGRDELPVWKDVAECVAALAAFHHLNHLKVISPVRISIRRLARKLTAGLVGSDGDAAEALDVILQLLDCLMLQSEEGEDGPSLVIDPSMASQSGCSQEMRLLLEHLWTTLLNWTMRVDPASKERLFHSIWQLMRYSQRSLPADQFALLASQPWNYLILVDALPSASSGATHLAKQLIHLSKSTSDKTCGTHPWSIQLEERLDGRPLF